MRKDARLLERTQAQETYLNAFASRETSKSEPDWLRSLRVDAMDQFKEIGFPTTRDEEWKYTDISPITEMLRAPQFSFHPNGVSQSHPDLPLLDTVTGHRLVFINGNYAPEYCSVGDLPSNVVVSDLASALEKHNDIIEEHLGYYAPAQDDAFAAINTAFWKNGAFVHIPDGVEMDEPIHLLFVSAPGEVAAVSHPRNLIVAGKNSHSQIVESFVCAGDATYLTNSVTEVVMREGAVLDHYKVQMESENAFHIATLQVQAEAKSNFFSDAITFGGRIARTSANAVMVGEHCECTLNGLYLGRGEQVIDNHTTMDHTMPHCQSYEVFAGILDDKSRGVFNGKIFVREDAQKTDAKQSNRGLLLSDDAELDTKPQLEIFADDVKCTHGATIGQLDEDAQFYLQARGIPADEARDILIYAFAGEVLDNIRIESLREVLRHELLSRLAHGREIEAIAE